MKPQQFKKLQSISVFLLLFFIIVLLCKPFFPHHDTLATDQEVKKGLQSLKESQAALDQDVISSKIANASYQIELQIRKESGLPIDQKFQFKRCALLGDSMASGLVDYRLLDPSNVFAQRGRRIQTSEAEIKAAIAFHPQHLFIQFGMNDIIYYRGDCNAFIKDYEAMLDKIETALPNTSIYVIPIQPIQPKAIKSQPALSGYLEYNKAMQALCERRKLTYVDVTALITPSSPYEFDGIHPKMPYYSDWVNLMIMAMKQSKAGAAYEIN